MQALEREFLGKTYDDFLLRPQLSTVTSRQQVKLKSALSRNIALNLPVVSANMDSVTEAEMAKAMALEGGLGFVHRGQSIEAQVAQVVGTKRTHTFVVENPLCLPKNATLGEAREFTRRHRITGILIEERAGSGILAGLLSNRDMPRLDYDESVSVERLMTPRSRLKTAPVDIEARAAERIMFENRIEKLPLVDSNGRVRGLITMKDLALFRNRPESSYDEKGRLLVGAAIGAHGDFLERAQALVTAGADALLIDIAHGHSTVMKSAIEAFRKRFPDQQLICGNVGTFEGALFLKELGADAIKVGIGPGRGCRTRLETAAGVPQLQAIREAWLATAGEVPIIADGGIKNDKDIFLALVCGASTVMLGSMLSGTDEAPGHLIEDPATHQKRKIYRGMTSPQAVYESLYDTEERGALKDALETPSEGQEVQVPYRGRLVDILHRVRGHLCSAVSYAGELSLDAARRKILPKPFDYLIPLSGAARQESFER